MQIKADIKYINQKLGSGFNPLIGEWTVIQTQQAQPADRFLFDRAMSLHYEAIAIQQMAVMQHLRIPTAIKEEEEDWVGLLADSVKYAEFTGSSPKALAARILIGTPQTALWKQS